MSRKQKVVFLANFGRTNYKYNIIFLHNLNIENSTKNSIFLKYISLNEINQVVNKVTDFFFFYRDILNADKYVFLFF